ADAHEIDAGRDRMAVTPRIASTIAEIFRRDGLSLFRQSLDHAMAARPFAIGKEIAEKDHRDDRDPEHYDDANGMGENEHGRSPQGRRATSLRCRDKPIRM